MTYRVYTGDVAEILPMLDTASFDAVLCDPPYGLSFMGKAWDHGVPSAEVWREVLRVVKPGAHLIAFGGTRTFHRLTCAIEDAGFEIRDCLCWLYGQGFPRSLDISKAIDRAAGAERRVVGSKLGQPGYSESVGKGGLYGDGIGANGDGRRECEITAPATPDAGLWSGYGTALKPAWEPAILAMKPTAGTFAANALAHGVAGLNVDGCRIGWSSDNERQEVNARSGPNSRFLGSVERSVALGDKRPHAVEDKTHAAGRWPANVALDEEAAAMLDEMSGERTTSKPGRVIRRNEGANGIASADLRRLGRPEVAYGDTGGASRFFYVAKASRGEREAGLREAGGIRTDAPRASETDKHPRVINHHPTVKPIKLAEWLSRLILPPKRDTPRRLLVPFSGSGSEMIGALRAGWDEVVGIEREAEYVEIAEARLAHWANGLNRDIFDEGAA